MDDLVLQALRKWPSVPHCYDWLGLDERGDWYLRDDATQAAGAFPAVKGSRLTHEKLIGFIHRNYSTDEQGQWFFQNGPQRVYVSLAYAPWVWRVHPDGALVAHSGLAAQLQGLYLDEHGKLSALTDLGLGLVHSLDIVTAADLIEQNQWPQPEQVTSTQLPSRFGFVCQPRPDNMLVSVSAP